MRLARRLAHVAPSSTLAVKQAAADLRARGRSVIDFGPGEPDFPTPAHIVEAAKAALDRGETHYSAGAGLPELRQALAEGLSRRGDTPLEASNVVVTCGGKSAILYALLALLDEGDEVLLPAPCWVSFPEQVRLAGGRPVLLPTLAEGGFQPDLEQLEAALTPRTRMIVVNSPSNPTGAILEDRLWDALAEVALRHDLTVLSDETYLDFVYDGRAAASALSRAAAFGHRLVVVGSFSKTYAMTGWRVGYACADPRLVQAMVTLQSQDTTHPTLFAQHGALAALQGPGEALAAMTSEYAARRRLILEEMATVPGFRCAPPDGAFYLFPDVREAMARTGCADDAELALRLLREAGVAVVAGSAFAGPGHVRLSYAVSRDEIRAGAGRIRTWVREAGQ